MRLQPLNRFGRWGVFQQPARFRGGLAEGEDVPLEPVVRLRSHAPPVSSSADPNISVGRRCSRDEF